MLRFAVVLLLASTGAQALEIAGPAHVTDGDTIWIGQTKIRLNGIDAPESKQVCLRANGAAWGCGEAASARLRAKIEGQTVSCASSEQDRYGRAIATCRIDGEDVNRWMVEQGLAIAYVQYSTVYVGAEAEARQAHRGLWAGAFAAPWDWRYHKAEATPLGDLKVDAGQYAVLGIGASESAQRACPIKGNINAKGKHIYHVPGGHDYERTVIDESAGERWFCSEDEAQKAGWRRAAR